MPSIEQREAVHRESVLKAMKALTELQANVDKDPHRLGFHFMAPAAWINDPNGMIHFEGEYHLFYQIHPYSADNGLKHWGHAKSKDLVRWEHLPIALAPSEPFEANGCFSGSAVNDNGTFTILYTGNVAPPNKKQVQCIATSKDGITFTKYAGNPILVDFPEDGSVDFRDPKVWKHDGIWYMALGSGKDGVANALLYKSPNLLEWEYVGVMARGEPGQGIFWNCPDFFELEGRDVMLASPGVTPKQRDIRTNFYRVGRLDYASGTFHSEQEGGVDLGPDFYAPQTLLDDKGRIVLIGWMDMWWNPMPTKAFGWTGAMTLPRVVKLRGDGKLAFEPVPELQELREEQASFGEIVIAPDTANVLGGVRGDCLEIDIRIDLKSSTAASFGLKLRRSDDGTEETVVKYDTERGDILVDRTKSGAVDGGVHRFHAESSPDGTLRLHVFLDRSSLELYVNDGSAVASYRLYPNAGSLGTELFVEEGQVELLSLDVWKVKSIWG